MLFSHPKDFTPCTTELGYVARIKPEFDKRNVKVIGLSVDPVDATRSGPTTSPRPGHGGELPDDRRSRAQGRRPYDMIHPNASEDTLTVRSVFVIGRDKKVKLTITYPAATGRDFDEFCASSTACS